MRRPAERRGGFEGGARAGSRSSAAHPPEGQPACHRRRHPGAPSITKRVRLTVRDLVGMDLINRFTRLPSHRDAGI
jgi:hypothetical protein